MKAVWLALMISFMHGARRIANPLENSLLKTFNICTISKGSMSLHLKNIVIFQKINQLKKISFVQRRRLIMPTKS
jgi:hypothetical protein